MTTVRIANPADARALAPKYDVEWPAGRGRTPLGKLASAIVAKGDTIDDTPYFSAAMANGPQGGIKAMLERIVVSADAAATAKDMLAALGTKSVAPAKPASDVKYVVKAVVPNSSGKGKRPAKVTMTLAEIREHGNAMGQRGRVSESTILAAAAKLKGWGDPAELDASKVSITKLDNSPVVEAVEPAATAAA
jgi:hypothetical protein